MFCKKIKHTSLNYKILISGTLRKNITYIIIKILKELQSFNYILYITFVDNIQISIINYKWNFVENSTDVLTFENKKLNGLYIVGDIIISIEKAILSSNFFKTNLENEIGFLLIHGFFHLLGLNHEKDALSNKIQTELEMTILNKIGLSHKVLIYKKYFFI